MSQQLSETAETHIQQLPSDLLKSSNQSMRARKTNVLKHQKRLCFVQALNEGASVHDASVIAKISISTGHRWAKVYRPKRIGESESEPIQLDPSILSKDELAKLISTKIADPMTPPHVIAALSTSFARLQGYVNQESVETSETRARVALRDLVLDWINERATIDGSLSAESNQPKPAPTTALIEGDITHVIGPDNAAGGQAGAGGSPQAIADGAVQGHSPTATKIQEPVAVCCCACHAKGGGGV